MKTSICFKKGISITILLLFISSFLAGEKTEKVDRLFALWDKPDSPGCALAIIKDGRLIYKKGYGMANLELNVPITPQTVFYIGSCSKQFLAFCIALLAQQKKLSFDDDIRKYLPEMPDYGNPITINHLIHHTSGLRDYLSLEEIAGIPLGFYHQQKALKLIARQRALNFRPGEEYLYSNSGYLLLAEILTRVSGQSLASFAREKIFKPLMMKNSHFHDDYTKLIKNRASGYLPDTEGKDKFKNFISTFDCVGSGGLYTSVEDLFLWDQNFYHHQVGDPDLIQMMQKPGSLNNGQKLNYGFGLYLGIYRGLKTVGHSGALGGYRAAMIRFPEEKFSVICLSNLSSFKPMKLCLQIADIYLAPDFKEEKKEELESLKQRKKENLKTEQALPMTSEQLKAYEGSYFSYELQIIFKVILKEGQLYLVQSNARKSLLRPISGDIFTCPQYKIKFLRDKNKKVTSFLLSTVRVRNLRFDKRR